MTNATDITINSILAAFRINPIHDARNAFGEVVESIAHSHADYDAHAAFFDNLIDDLHADPLIYLDPADDADRDAIIDADAITALIATEFAAHDCDDSECND